MIELLIICLKDSSDSDFVPLYNSGLEILSVIVNKEKRNPMVKMEYGLGGIVSLLMLAVENEELE